MEERNKFIYSQGDLKASLSQCTHCSKRHSSIQCEYFDKIPLDILINKRMCDTFISKCITNILETD